MMYHEGKSAFQRAELRPYHRSSVTSGFWSLGGNGFTVPAQLNVRILGPTDIMCLPLFLLAYGSFSLAFMYRCHHWMMDNRKK